MSSQIINDVIFTKRSVASIVARDHNILLGVVSNASSENAYRETDLTIMGTKGVRLPVYTALDTGDVILDITSSTSIDLSTLNVGDNQPFTLTIGSVTESISNGMIVRMYLESSPSIYIQGEVFSYDTSVLILTVQFVSGSGTLPIAPDNWRFLLKKIVYPIGTIRVNASGERTRLELQNRVSEWVGLADINDLPQYQWQSPSDDMLVTTSRIHVQPNLVNVSSANLISVAVTIRDVTPTLLMGYNDSISEPSGQSRLIMIPGKGSALPGSVGGFELNVHTTSENIYSNALKIKPVIGLNLDEISDASQDIVSVEHTSIYPHGITIDPKYGDTPIYTVKEARRESNIATLWTNEKHNFSAGQTITIVIPDDTTFSLSIAEILSVNTAENSLTYTNGGPDFERAAVTGTVSLDATLAVELKPLAQPVLHILRSDTLPGSAANIQTAPILKIEKKYPGGDIGNLCSSQDTILEVSNSENNILSMNSWGRMYINSNDTGNVENSFLTVGTNDIRSTENMYITRFNDDSNIGANGLLVQTTQTNKDILRLRCNATNVLVLNGEGKLSVSGVTTIQGGLSVMGSANIYEGIVSKGNLIISTLGTETTATLRNRQIEITGNETGLKLISNITSGTGNALVSIEVANAATNNNVPVLTLKRLDQARNIVLDSNSQTLFNHVNASITTTSGLLDSIGNLGINGKLVVGSLSISNSTSDQFVINGVPSASTLNTVFNNRNDSNEAETVFRFQRAGSDKWLLKANVSELGDRPFEILKPDLIDRPRRFMIDGSGNITMGSQGDNSVGTSTRIYGGEVIIDGRLSVLGGAQIIGTLSIQDLIRGARLEITAGANIGGELDVDTIRVRNGGVYTGNHIFNGSISVSTIYGHVVPTNAAVSWNSLPNALTTTANVGIGTSTDPDTNFFVNGNTRLNGKLHVATSNVNMSTPNVSNVVIKSNITVGSGSDNLDQNFHTSTLNVLAASGSNSSVKIDNPTFNGSPSLILSQNGVPSTAITISKLDNRPDLVINTNGNVGIGTVIGTLTPISHKLHVVGDVNFTGNLYQNGILYSGGGVPSDWIKTGSSLTYTSGNVGIGTATPSGKLHISGPNNGANSAASASILLTGDGSSPSEGLPNTNAVYHRSQVGLGLQSDQHMSFQVNGGTEAMRILNTGFVGIGRSDPFYALDVIGDIRASGRIYPKQFLRNFDFNGVGSDNFASSGSSRRIVCTHGLGYTPINIRLFAVRRISTDGWLANTRVLLTNSVDTGHYTFTVFADSSNVGIISDSTTAISILSPTFIRSYIYQVDQWYLLFICD